MTFMGDRLGPWFERALDLASRRRDLLASNVANVDTPNFVPRDLEFRDALKQELAHHEIGLSTDGLSADLRYDVPPRLDGNRVDLDKELTQTASNRIFHELTTELVSRRIAMMRYSIDEGGR